MGNFIIFFNWQFAFSSNFILVEFKHEHEHKCRHKHELGDLSYNKNPISTCVTWVEFDSTYDYNGLSRTIIRIS